MNDEASGNLQALGFSEYEARAYVSLLQRGRMTGYQLAKESGIPRPNIYPVLDRLQERGAVSRVGVKEGAQYVALPAEEMLSRLGRETEVRLERARAAIKDIESAPETAQVWNLQGYDVMIERARALIDGSQKSLLIGNWSNEAKELAAAVAAADTRGVTLTTLCIQGCAEECGGCCGEIYRYPLAADAGERWLVVVVDDSELLVGQVSPRAAVAAVTRIEVFVAIGGHYLRNAVAAAEIVRSLGPDMEQVLDERAMGALRGVGLAAGGSSWFDRMLAVSRSSG